MGRMWVGLGILCSKTRPLRYAPMLPTTSYYAPLTGHHALGWVLLCSINWPWLGAIMRLLCLEFI